MGYDQLNYVEGLKLDLDFLSDGSEREELMNNLFGDDSDSGEGFATEDNSGWESFFSDYSDGNTEEDSTDSTQNSDQQSADVPKKTEETVENESTGGGTDSGTEPSGGSDLSSFFE